MSDALCHAAAALVRYFNFFSYILFYLGMVQEQRSDANDVEMNGVKMQAVKNTKNILKDWKKRKAYKTHLHTKSRENTKHLVRSEEIIRRLSVVLRKRLDKVSG